MKFARKKKKIENWKIIIISIVVAMPLSDIQNLLLIFRMKSRIETGK